MDLLDLEQNNTLSESQLVKAEEFVLGKLFVDDKCIFDVNTPYGKEILDKFIKEEAARIVERMLLLKQIEEAIKTEPSFHDDVLELLFRVASRKVLIEKIK